MSEPTDDLVRLAERYTGKLRNALLEAYSSFLESVSEEDIMTAFKYGGVQGLATLASRIGTDMANSAVHVLADAWQESGRMIISLLPDGAVSDGFVFDNLPVGAISSAEEHRARFVTGISESARQTIIDAVTAGIITGSNPRKIARDFRSAIGLTEWQEGAVEHYREYLESLDPRALERALRDHRSDSVILRHIESGEPLDQEYIDSLVERYRQRMIKWRSEMIARVEAMRAVHMGEYESLYAAWLEGKISPDLRRFWVTAMDERVRANHAVIPERNKMGVTIDQSFDTPLGPMRYPLDPNGVAANVINCRCTVIYRIVHGLEDLPMYTRRLWARSK